MFSKFLDILKELAISKQRQDTSSPLPPDVELYTPHNDSGFELDASLMVVESDDDVGGNIENHNVEHLAEKKLNTLYKKPKRPCLFCKEAQTRLKRHILFKHKTHPRVVPILNMNRKEKDQAVAVFRREAIRVFNIDALKTGDFEKEGLMRERASKLDEMPVMCSGCKGFYAKGYKSRHVCPEKTTSVMLPMVAVENVETLERYSKEFQDLLKTLRLDEVGNYLKTDEVILMLGYRSFNAIKRKADKKTETKKTVRSRMRLLARLYLVFREEYSHSEVDLSNKLGNVADIYRREVITILGEAINKLCQKSDEDDADVTNQSVSDQKSGLKISILNLLKLTSKLLVGYFLMKNQDDQADKVKDFVTVLKLFEEELFGDAYYDTNFRKNVKDRKPINLPNDNDVKILLDECNKIMNSPDIFNMCATSFVLIRAAAATCLIIFNARRGGEPVRLLISQWEEALKGEWVDENDLPDEVDSSVLVTYQTGKGSNHLVPVMFPPECHKALKYLTDKDIRSGAGVCPKNMYIFPSTKKSDSHPDGWHCINDILVKLDKKGALNATANRHRVATLLARLQLTEKEKEMIFKHFGHSKNMNENRYQAAPGSMQLRTTGSRLLEIQGSSSKSKQDVKVGKKSF